MNGSPNMPTEPGLSRRELLRRSGMGLGALGLAGLLADQGAFGDAAPPVRPPMRWPRVPRTSPARRSGSIHFFLNGGPSHVDTFDPKPALAKYAGQPLPESLTHRAQDRRGVPLAVQVPQVRRRAASRSASSSPRRPSTSTTSPSSARCTRRCRIMSRRLMLMNCGDSVQPRPSVGAWVLYGLGSENQNLPGFVAMCPGGYPIKDAENWQSGFLPGALPGDLRRPAAHRRSTS